MLLTEFLNNLQKKFDSILLGEAELAKAHLTHPEDIVLMQGSSGVEAALDRMSQTISNPQETTIKWDGSPALIFGFGPDGKFRVMDKHMFDKVDSSGRNVFSPKQFQQYDINRGVDRGDLATTVAHLWPDLKKAASAGKGYYWGDVLFGSQLKPQNGAYVFQPNPTGIQYRVQADSDFARQNIANKVAGIAVHQFIPADAQERAAEATQQAKSKGSKETFKATDFATSLNGTLGNLKVDPNGKVAILPSKMALTPEMNTQGWENTINRVRKKVQSVAGSIDKIVAGIPGANKTTNDAFKMFLTSYINYEVRKIAPALNAAKTPKQRDAIVDGVLKDIGTDFGNFIQQKLATAKMTENNKALILEFIKQNYKGILALYNTWADLYKLKMHIYKDLDVAGRQSPVKGYLSSGEESQEGYVAHGVKYVDRLGGFSAQHLGARG